LYGVVKIEQKKHCSKIPSKSMRDAEIAFAAYQPLSFYGIFLTVLQCDDNKLLAFKK
jgi:hypothetical protein